MRKLRLDLDQLEVDSFRTGEAYGVGTIQAHSDSDVEVCLQPGDDQVAITVPVTWAKTCDTCPGLYTCNLSCIRTEPGCTTCT
ncbi:MAG TPA: hypothetical protein VF092_16640 [Longimicrobium sp.]